MSPAATLQSSLYLLPLGHQIHFENYMKIPNKKP